MIELTVGKCFMNSVCPFDLAKNFVLICEKVVSVAQVISDRLGIVFQCDRPGAIGKITWKPGLIPGGIN